MKSYIAIPSMREATGGIFRRVGNWNQEEEIIQVRAEGSACLVKATEADADAALWIVSPEFLTDASKAKALLKRELAGIFLHPGFTNTPGKDQINQFIGGREYLEGIRDLIVAFTISGSSEYRVPCLGIIWNWLQQANDGEKVIQDAVLEDLPKNYLRLKGQGSREHLVRLCVLAQGVLEPELREDVRAEFRTWFSTLMEDNRDWLQVADSPIAVIVKAIPGQPNDDALAQFLDAARKHFETVSSDPR